MFVQVIWGRWGGDPRKQEGSIRESKTEKEQKPIGACVTKGTEWATGVDSMQTSEKVQNAPRIVLLQTGG